MTCACRFKSALRSIEMLVRKTGQPIYNELLTAINARQLAPEQRFKAVVFASERLPEDDNLRKQVDWHARLLSRGR